MASPDSERYFLQQQRGRTKFPPSPVGDRLHIEKVPVVVGKRRNGALELIFPSDRIEVFADKNADVTRDYDGADLFFVPLAPGQKVNVRVPDGKWHTVTNVTPPPQMA